MTVGASRCHRLLLQGKKSRLLLNLLRGHIGRSAVCRESLRQGVRSLCIALPADRVARAADAVRARRAGRATIRARSGRSYCCNLCTLLLLLQSKLEVLLLLLQREKRVGVRGSCGCRWCRSSTIAGGGHGCCCLSLCLSLCDGLLRLRLR